MKPLPGERIRTYDVIAHGVLKEANDRCKSRFSLNGSITMGDRLFGRPSRPRMVASRLRRILAEVERAVSKEVFIN